MKMKLIFEVKSYFFGCPPHPPPPFSLTLNLVFYLYFCFFSIAANLPHEIICPWQIPIFKKQYDKRTTIIIIRSMLILNWKSYFQL